MDLFLQNQKGKNRKIVISGPTPIFFVNLNATEVIWYRKSVTFGHFSLNHNEK